MYVYYEVITFHCNFNLFRINHRRIKEGIYEARVNLTPEPNKTRGFYQDPAIKYNSNNNDYSLDRIDFEGLSKKELDTILAIFVDSTNRRFPSRVANYNQLLLDRSTKRAEDLMEKAEAEKLKWNF